MHYSYITPRKKSIFTQEVQLVLSFFSITLMMLFLTYFFLLYKTYSFDNTKTVLQNEKTILKSSLDKIESSIAFIEKQKSLSETVFTKNVVLKDSISNLFDLVPTRITLSEAKLLENGLILYGITPNRDVYNFMLQAPLRSIFHKTYSSFYPAKSGWLHFVSTNYLNKEETLDEE